MEYIYPCYEAHLGDNIACNIIAVTTDEKDIDRKKERCAFPVILNDCTKALESLKHDMIFVAPPPSATPQIIDDVLVPYFDLCRKNNYPLPIIYAYPPTPTGADYLSKLGKDLLVVNILPNMVTEIGDVDLSGMGLTYITFPDEKPWDEEHKKELADFLFQWVALLK